MSKNHRRHSAGLLARPALAALFWCIFLAAAGVGYVYQREQIGKLGTQIKTNEIRLEELRRQTETLNRVLAGLSSPQELDARVKRMNLGLAAPQPEQIVRVLEPSAGRGGRVLLARGEPGR